MSHCVFFLSKHLSKKCITRSDIYNWKGNQSFSVISILISIRQMFFIGEKCVWACSFNAECTVSYTKYLINHFTVVTHSYSQNFLHTDSSCYRLSYNFGYQNIREKYCKTNFTILLFPRECFWFTSVAIYSLVRGQLIYIPYLWK